MIVGILIAARLALPYEVKKYVNEKMTALDSYNGHVDDIDIHLWRGAYSLRGLEIKKTGTKQRMPFFKAKRINLSVEWHSLLRGSVVSKAEFLAPEINLVQGESKQDTQLGGEENWNRRLEELFPFRFNTITVHGGTVRFLAPAIKTKDAITARNIEGQVTNLTNVVKTGKETFADFSLTGTVLDGAPASVKGSVNALAAQPTFDVNMEVKRVQLPQVNPWLEEYIKADAESGKFELYMELAAADGKFAGYAKPILENVKIYRSGEPEKNPLKRAWEKFLDFAFDVLKNKDADQVAARIPFKGTVQHPQTSLFATIASVLHNAFISAFARSLEGSISLRDVKKNLNGIDPTPPDKESKKEYKEEKAKEKKAQNEKAATEKPASAAKKSGSAYKN